MFDLKVTDRSLIWNSDLIEALELQNLMLNALQVTDTFYRFSHGLTDIHYHRRVPERLLNVNAGSLVEHPGSSAWSPGQFRIISRAWRLSSNQW